MSNSCAERREQPIKKKMVDKYIFFMVFVIKNLKFVEFYTVHL